MPTIRPLLIATLVLFLSVSGVVAQPQPEFEPGQTVYFEQFGEWKGGTIVKVEDNGWYRVRHQFGGKLRVGLFPPRDLHESPTAAPEPPRVGDTVEFDFLGDPRQGMVIEVDARRATVRFEHRGKEREQRVTFDRMRVVGNDASAPAAEHAPPPPRRTPAAAPPAGPAFAVRPSRDGARRVVIDAQVPWRYTPVTAPPTPARSGAYAVELGYGRDLFARPGAIAEIVAPAWAHGPGLIVSSSTGRNGTTGMRLELLRFGDDDGALARVGLVAGPLNRRLLSASSDGTLVALTDVLGGQPCVEFRRIDDDRLAPQLRLETPEGKHAYRLPWVAMVGSSRGLVELAGALELWDVTTGRLIASFDASPRGAAFVDAARSHAFVPQDGWTAIIDLRDTSVVGRLDVQFALRDAVRVHRDGTQIAWVEDEAVVTMDLADGARPARRMSIPADFPGRSLQWLDDARLLVDGRLVVDAARGAAVAWLDVEGSGTGPAAPGPGALAVTCAHGVIWANRRGAGRSPHVLTGLGVADVATPVSVDDTDPDRLAVIALPRIDAARPASVDAGDGDAHGDAD